MPLMMLSACLDGKALTGWSAAVASGVLITCHTANMCSSCMGMFKDNVIQLQQQKVGCMRPCQLLLLLDPSENGAKWDLADCSSALSCRTATLAQVIMSLVPKQYP